jgi:hypothetical protein
VTSVGTLGTAGIAGIAGEGRVESTGGGLGGTGTAASASCMVEEISSATDVVVAPVLCVSAPSSPGLSTRTEIEMLHPKHAPRSGGDCAPEPQLQSQFQTHPEPEDEAGVIELAPTESSEQFQLQFQTQVTGPLSPKSGRVTDVVSEVLGDIFVFELVLPIFAP